LPGYRLEDEIGTGSTSKVFKARRTATNELVAVKILYPSLVDNWETVKRFQQEAELTKRLTSRHIVAVQAHGLAKDGRPYMVMDYIEGVTVNSLFDKEGALAPERALPILIQVAAGLAHAHNHGIMHRDIKPNNLMLMDKHNKRDHVQIVDFGIAKKWAESGNNSTIMTPAGDSIGSPLYMSPEQCLGKGMDHRTDIYSLGTVMYEMLTGRPVFTARDAVAVMTKHVKEAPAPLGLPESAAFAGIEHIVLKALAKRANDRYAHISERKSELQFCVDRMRMENRIVEKRDRKAA
jgi:serine/threonine-protein kinase